MANENALGFKRGTQENLNALTSSEVGVFYLTTNTNRLYIGKGTGQKPVLVNNTIISVNSLDEIDKPVAGEYYYITGSNILAYRDGEQWVQLNPNTDTKLSSAKFSKNAQESDETKLVYDLTLELKDVGNNVLLPVTTQLEINSADVTGITTETAVDINATVAENKVTVKTSGAGSSGDGFTVAAGDNVTIDGSADAITIKTKDTTYDLSSSNNSTAITLTEKGGKTSSVDLVAGTNIALDGAKTGEITINHDSVTTTPTTGQDTTLTHGGSFNAITGVTVANGHVTGYETEKFILPEDNNNINESMTVTTADNGGLDIVVEDNKGKKVTGELAEGLYYTFGDEKVYNKGDLANSNYLSGLKSKVETLEKNLANIDALRYRGTVGQTTGTVANLPTTNVQIGDTYKVADAGEYWSTIASVGDLFIAIGEEDEKGYITAETLDWTLVVSGAETDTTYTLSGATNKITLKASTDDGITSGDITVKNGIDISTTVSDNTLTVNHTEVTRKDDEVKTSTATHGGTITVVTGVKSSATGHVDGVEKTTITLPEDQNTTYTLPAAVVTADKATKITLTANDGPTDVVNFNAGQTNSSLKVTATEDTITYEHKNYSYTNPTDVTATGTLSHGNELTVVTGANVENGHITGLSTTTYTLPADNDSKYALSGVTTAKATDTGKVSAIILTDTLTGSGSAEGKVSTSTTTITSDTLNLTAETNGYNVDIEWGTF